MWLDLVNGCTVWDLFHLQLIQSIYTTQKIPDQMPGFSF
jgi:hypothetical protein